MEVDGDVLPKPGDIEIVVDHLNEPALVTRLTTVEIVPYSAVTPEYAAIEGEGDSSLNYWRKAHWNFFTRECHRIGREPSESMLVVWSAFLPAKDRPVWSTGARCGVRHGTRVAALLRAGIDIDGCDISGDMLQHCQRRAAEAGFSVQMYQQPMSAFNLPRRYKTIYLCDSFGLAGRHSRSPRRGWQRAHRPLPHH